MQPAERRVAPPGYGGEGGGAGMRMRAGRGMDGLAAAGPRDDDEAHETLAGMGFVDRARNQRLLDRHGGDVTRVLDELLG